MITSLLVVTSYEEIEYAKPASTRQLLSLPSFSLPPPLVPSLSASRSGQSGRNRETAWEWCVQRVTKLMSS